MPAIRIIDDHIELASIGANTHAQIDTHISAADNYVKRDGSLALTADWDIGDTRKILADEIRARDAAGLKLYDDGGKGIFVKDGGQLVIESTTYAIIRLQSKSAGASAYSGLNIYEDNGALAASFVYGNPSAASFTNEFIFASRQSDIDLVLYQGGAASANERLRLKSGGNVVFSNCDVGIAATSPTAKLDVNSDILRLRTAKTPATAGAAGNQGDICWDASFIYVCTATNSWERAAIAAW